MLVFFFAEVAQFLSLGGWVLSDFLKYGRWLI